MTTPMTGGCQCGAVRYKVGGEPLALFACHCAECQRQSGSAFGLSMIVKRDDFVLERGTLKSFERATDSGRTISGHFCPDCGVRIYHLPTWREGVLTLKPGTLDDTGWLRPSGHVWTDSAQPWVAIPETGENHPTQPF